MRLQRTLYCNKKKKYIDYGRNLRNKVYNEKNFTNCFFMLFTYFIYLPVYFYFGYCK